MKILKWLSVIFLSFSVLIVTITQAGDVRAPVQTLLASDGAEDAYFGQVMAADGTTVAIAAPRANSDTGTDTGAVYIYVKSGGTWTFQQKLTPSDEGADDNFGASLALSGDTLIVGAPIKNSNTGAVYVFTRSGTTWTERKKITYATDASQNDLFGSALALQGTTLLIGAPGEGSGVFPKGAVYVYQGSGDTWNFQQKLTISDGIAGDFFGASLALEGTRLLVGAPFQSTSLQNTFVGAAYVFTLSSGTWGQTGKLTAQGGAKEDYFGWSVALDGDTAFVGAPQAIGVTGFPNDVAGSGKVYAFGYNGTTWSQQGGAITAADAGTDERFGWQIILDGTTAYISDDGADEIVNAQNRADVGAVYTFTSNGSGWAQEAKLSPEQQFADNEFGGSIALTANTLFVGAPGVDLDAGAVYVYGEAAEPTPTNTAQSGTLTATPTMGTASPTPTDDPITSTPTVATGTPTETPVGALELVVNGGFELDANTDGAADNWTAKNATGDKRKCNKPGKQIAFEGECAYQFKSTAGENSKLEQNVDMTAFNLNTGDELVLSGVANAKGAVNAKVKVRVAYGNTALPKGKITAKIIPSDGYQPFNGTLNLVLVDDPTGVKIQLQNKGTSGKVRFDAISLTKQPTTLRLP